MTETSTEINGKLPRYIIESQKRFAEQQDELARTAAIKAANPPPAPMITAADVKEMIVAATKLLLQQIEAQQKAMSVLQLKVEKLGLELIDLQLERQNPIAKAPTDPRKMFPQVHEISRIRAQIFHNSGKGKVARKLKLSVWTCPVNEIGKHLNGTCGFYFINLADPTHRSYRRYMGDSLDYLNADDAKLLGCLSLKLHDKRKYPDQAAVITPDDRLILSLYGKSVDMGPMNSINGTTIGSPKGEWDIRLTPSSGGE